MPRTGCHRPGVACSSQSCPPGPPDISSSALAAPGEKVAAAASFFARPGGSFFRPGSRRPGMPREGRVWARRARREGPSSRRNRQKGSSSASWPPSAERVWSWTCRGQVVHPRPLEKSRTLNARRVPAPARQSRATPTRLLEIHKTNPQKRLTVTEEAHDSVTGAARATVPAWALPPPPGPSSSPARPATSGAGSCRACSRPATASGASPASRASSTGGPGRATPAWRSWPATRPTSRPCGGPWKAAGRPSTSCTRWWRPATSTPSATGPWPRPSRARPRTRASSASCTSAAWGSWARASPSTSPRGARSRSSSPRGRRP